MKRSKGVWQAAHVRLQGAVRRQKIHADRHRRPAPRNAAEQEVWLSTRDVRRRLPCRKLSPKYIGPFKILRQVNPVAYRLQLPHQYRISPTFHFSLLKPMVGGEGVPVHAPLSGPAPPPPLLLDDGPVYAVRTLLQSRRRRGRLQYLVNWEGYGPEERSWVPAADVLDPSLISDFHREHPDAPAPVVGLLAVVLGRRLPPLGRGVL